MSIDNIGDDAVVVTISQACEMLKISPDTLRRLHNQGEAPLRVQLSKRRFGYRVSTLKAWLKSREGQCD